MYLPICLLSYYLSIDRNNWNDDEQMLIVPIYDPYFPFFTFLTINCIIICYILIVLNTILKNIKRLNKL